MYKAGMFDHYPEEERAKILRDNCDGIEPVNYNEVFSPEDLTVFKDELSTLDLDMEDIEIRKKEFMEEIKAELDPIKARHKELLTNIRLKQKNVKKDCFKFYDHERGTVGYFDARGNLVDTRMMRPEERQYKMKVLRSGTDD